MVYVSAGSLMHLCPAGLAAVVAMAGAGCATVGRDVAGIRNFDEVSPQLYRGGQPSAVGIRTLAAMHIRTVINLRDDAVKGEAVAVRGAGMTYVSLPQNAAAVTPADAEAFLAVLATAETPVFVHCQLGRDRTGLAVAAYRVRVEHWTAQAALADLYAHGHDWFLFPRVRAVIRALDESGGRGPRGEGGRERGSDGAGHRHESL